MMYNILIKKMK